MPRKSHPRALHGEITRHANLSLTGVGISTSSQAKITAMKFIESRPFPIRGRRAQTDGDRQQHRAGAGTARSRA
jgi:hypothetical protein